MSNNNNNDDGGDDSNIIKSKKGWRNKNKINKKQIILEWNIC